ncbi:hypothetical protein BXZ70DRAFT_705743 [Cristinia sonorae]|uniref:Tail specific protease domain-containing protein n=1 Tax=Cristinia sonorae TaxID=1940300 RepID=A0A8K0UFB6_9AGAR|nr:hypothetical protein BXZ70DRAFT_705743 [Cristinia sonorae]
MLRTKLIILGVGSVLSCAASTLATNINTGDASLVSRQESDVSIDTLGDPCRAIAGKKWVSPKEVRACFNVIAVGPKAKDNILDVVDKTTAAFDHSRPYQKLAPPPFTGEIHENLSADIARIRRTHYKTEFDLHIDVSRSVKRLFDGHTVYFNDCYDSVFLNFLPIPLVYITDNRGVQHVHIAKDAFEVASKEFADQIDVWQNALPRNLRGKLSSLNGAKVLKIDGKDPLSAVDENAKIVGGYQALGTRQNGFFASYNVGADGKMAYSLGNFAQKSLPLDDEVILTIQRSGNISPETITLPYRSRIQTRATWTDKASYRQNLCVAQEGTNGVDAYAPGVLSQAETESPIFKFQQQPPVKVAERKHRAMSVAVDTIPKIDIVHPVQPTPVGNDGFTVSQFYLLDDRKTGVLGLGSFSGSSDSAFEGLQKSLLNGLQSLKAMGATRLIIDVTNNGGGWICVGHWLHRILAGPKASTEPHAGLLSRAPAGPLPLAIVKAIVEKNADPDWWTYHNGLGYQFPNATDFPPNYNWLQPVDKRVVNGELVQFSPLISDGCPASYMFDAPNKPLFDTKKVAILGNGRCASTCAQFSSLMAKKEGSKTVVFGGRKGVQQHYSGIVGGQSTDFVAMDTDVKTTGLKNHRDAPPDLITNSGQGINWRLDFGIWDIREPEEWQSRPADINLPLTLETANNPVAIWKQVAQLLWK